MCADWQIGRAGIAIRTLELTSSTLPYSF
jgi:hypothetical protein